MMQKTQDYDNICELEFERLSTFMCNLASHHTISRTRKNQWRGKIVPGYCSNMCSVIL